MPIPPPTPTAPYPLVDDALNLTRTRINDAIQSIGGEMLTNTQPFTQVMANGAWLKMQKFMASLGYSRARKRTVLTALPVVGSIDPASETILNWSWFFDGVSYYVPPNTPVLPQDLIAPLMVKERQTGTNQGFSRMDLLSNGENWDRRKQPRNGWFDWRNDELVMPGATLSVDLELFYSCALPSFQTVGATQWYEQPIPIIQAESALANFIGYEFAKPRGDLDAASFLTDGQQDCRDLLNTSEVPLRQRFNVSRRSYGGQQRSSGWSGGF